MLDYSSMKIDYLLKTKKTIFDGINQISLDKLNIMPTF